MTLQRNILIDSFTELANSCASFYEKKKDRMILKRVLKKRTKMSSFVESFHKDCGTVTPAVKEKIKGLRHETGLILMTAHQPNFFAYSGVFRKATLAFVLAKRLEEMLKVPVVNFFGIADQDFTDDRWVRSCQLPAIHKREGILSIDVNLPEKLMLNRVAKPSLDLLHKWKVEIENWLVKITQSTYSLCKDLNFRKLPFSTLTETFHKNFEFFWDIVECCYEHSGNYSDFNAFLISKIVNEAWGYDTVFSRFSECQQAFVDEFNFLLSHSHDYSTLLQEAREIPEEESGNEVVSDQELWLAPFWYHCLCGSKVRLLLVEQDEVQIGQGNCEKCGRRYRLEFGTRSNPDVSHICSQISARAIPMCLIFFNGLVPSCYVGGIGGVTYLKKAQHVADGLRIPFPPVVIWRPYDKYLGLGQMEALLELKRICRDLGVRDISTAKSLLKNRISEIRKHIAKLEASKEKIIAEMQEHASGEVKEEIKRISIAQTQIVRSSNLSGVCQELKILDNVSILLGLIPSIIDYAVNIGLEETSNQWIRHLSENGSLSSDVYLESVLSQNKKLDLIFDSWSLLNG